VVGNGGREQVARAPAAQHRSNRLDLAWPNDDARDFSWVHRGAALPACRRLRRGHDRYLVDPASSHMLVSKIKPCMSKCKYVYTVKLRMAH
jgi:hypothetical protein